MQEGVWGTIYMLIIVSWCIGSPSACGTMLHTYYCRSITSTGACGNMLHTYYSRSVNFQTMRLWNYVTHLLLQVGAAPDQVPVGPCYTLTIAGRYGTRPSACGTMLHTIAGWCGTRPSACGTVLHTYCCRLVRHQTKCLWDHATHLLLQVGAAPDQVPVRPCYTFTIAGWCVTRPRACLTMFHTYYCR